MKEEPSHTNLRIAIVFALMLAGFVVLAFRLYNEQISSGAAYRSTITKQSIRRIRIPAQRGRIYTDDLKVLADNEIRINLVVYPHEMRRVGRRKTVKNIFAAAERAAAMIGRRNPLSADQIREHLNRRPGLPLTVFEALSRDELARAVEFSNMTPGCAIERSWSRIYPCGMLASHLVGYVRPDDSRHADDRDDFFYYIPDQVGKAGIEKAFDRLNPEGFSPLRGLRGEPGYSLVRVDNMGFVRDVLIEEIEPKQGNHIVLTLDFRAQLIAESLFGERCGAFVLLDADNGDVLAMASAPGYDLGQFSPKLSSEYYRELRDDPKIPLYNRALQGLYTPGSILKPLVALAILGAGCDPEAVVVCDGVTKIGNSSIRCASHSYGGHGPVNMVKALEKSCNDYFIEFGLKIGLEPIREILQKAGIGTAPRFELPTRAGIAPSPEYKQRTTRSRWSAHDTGMLSIGQGAVALSPLQAALYCAALANGGTLYQPHLLRKIVDQRGIILSQPGKSVADVLDVPPAHLDIVRKGMFEVVNAPMGSGRRARVKGLTVYGKTGTAEIGPREKRTKNAWFIAFTEFNGRKYACALMYENAGSGGGDCAPMVADFFQRYCAPERP